MLQASSSKAQSVLAGTVGQLSGGGSADAGVVTVLSGLKSPQAIAADDQAAPFIALADGAVHGGVGLKPSSRPEILARVKREAILTCPLTFAI